MSNLETPPEDQEDTHDCDYCEEGVIYETEDNHWVCGNCNHNYGIGY